MRSKRKNRETTLGDAQSLPSSTSDSQLIEQVSKKEQRKLKARKQNRSVWFGLGMFGLVGWSIAIPTLIGIAIGIWIDRSWPGRFSCTLMCLFLGVVVGCWIAWYWIKREVLTDDILDGESTVESDVERQEDQ